jgi:type I restriction-modification system DNA methylase subunit
MSRFCVGEASRDLKNVSPLIEGEVDSLAVDWGQPDIVLMNPPFIAWDDLDPRQQSSVENVLGKYKVGKTDIYLAFLMRAANSLKRGGVLAAVVPAQTLIGAGLGNSVAAA